MKPIATFQLLFLFILIPISAQLQVQTDIGVNNKDVIRPYMRVDYARMFDGFPIGATFVNHGTETIDSAYVSATILSAQGDTIYADTLGPLTLQSQDSLFVYENESSQFAPFNSVVDTSLPGEYTLNYSAFVTQDEDSLNNSVSILYKLEYDTGDVTLSSVEIDNQGLPRHQNYFPDNFTTEHQVCTYWYEPNTFYFRGNPYSYYFDNVNIVLHVDSGEVLVGSEIFVNVLEWNDDWIDIDDTLFSISNGAFQDLSLVSFSTYYPSSNSEIDSVINIQLDNQVYPNSQKKYLICAQTFENQIKFGFDTTTQATNNIERVKQPIGAEFNDGIWSLLDGNKGVPSITFGFSDLHWGLSESTINQIEIYPNPTKDQLQFKLNDLGFATLEITDLHGRIVFNKDFELTEEMEVVNIQSLQSGSYTLLINLDSGERRISHFIKN